MMPSGGCSESERETRARERKSAAKEYTSRNRSFSFLFFVLLVFLSERMKMANRQNVYLLEDDHDNFSHDS